MKSKRALAIVIVIVLIAAGAGVYRALNSVKFTPWIIKKIVHKNFPQVTIDAIQVGAQRFRFPNEFTFSGIKAAIRQDKVSYKVEARELRAEGLLTAWRPKNDLKVDLKAFQLDSDIGAIQDLFTTAYVEMADGQIRNLTGTVQFREGRFGVYVVNDAACVLGHQDKKLFFKNVTAQAYGSKLNGEISLEYPPSLFYSVQIVFQDLDISRLKAVNADLPKQVEGVFSGAVAMSGRQADLQNLDLETHVVRDGKIRASLLNFVTQYMPSSKEREYLDKALESNGKVNVETGSVQLKSLSKNKLTALVKLFSKELNLDQNFVIDINSDGKLTTLLDYVDQFSIK